MAKKILLADDSVTIQKVVELTLGEPEYEVVAVDNGDDAIARLGAETPDLVLADVHMPGASGFEVARKAKELRSSLPVVLLVGAFEPFDEDEATASGADEHLQKPFDAEELRRRVDHWVGKGASEPAARAGERASEDGRSAASAADRDPVAVERSRASESAPPPAGGEIHLSEQQIDTIARRVVSLLDEGVLRDVAWEVIPDLAEIVIKERLRELESQVDSSDS